MRLAFFLLALYSLSYGQNLPFASQDPSLQANLDYLSSQIKTNKVSLANITVNGYVQAVSAGSPICSSGGQNPNITFCAAIPESDVTNLTSDLSARLLLSGGTMSGPLSVPSESVTGSLTVSTLTATGQDASGYSAKFSSGINAGNGCVLLQGGEVCGPTPGPTGATGPQGPAGQNGLLTFASDIVPYWIISSVSGSNYYALTVATDGALVVTSTTTAGQIYNYSNVTRKYLSNGAYTSRITVDDNDGVLRMKQNTVTLRMTDLAVADTNGVVWDIGLGSDGVIETSYAGSL